MTTATNVLRDEHKAILRMLDATEEVAKRIRADIPVTREILLGLTEFYQIFAERCHHRKEEDCLYPLLEKRIRNDGVDLADMMQEHAQGNEFIHQMLEALDAFFSDRKKAVSRWADSAFEFVKLFRAHISKENTILFAMGDQLLSDTDQEGLLKEFERVETEKIGVGMHERLHNLMERMYSLIFPSRH